jgi:signal recognition particle GTPase
MHVPLTESGTGLSMGGWWGRGGDVVLVDTAGRMQVQETVMGATCSTYRYVTAVNVVLL